MTPEESLQHGADSLAATDVDPDPRDVPVHALPLHPSAPRVHASTALGHPSMEPALHPPPRPVRSRLPANPHPPLPPVAAKAQPLTTAEVSGSVEDFVRAGFGSGQGLPEHG